jgi:hypothetical protein
MATDNTEPRTGLIFKIGFLSIVAVVAARYALVSYFDQEISKEYQAKLGTNEQLAALRAEADKSLHGGAMPIDKAMAMVATRPRMGMAAIAPKPSDDNGPMVGWTQRPQPPAPAAGTWSSAAPVDADAGTQADPAGTDGGAGLPSPTSAGPAGSAANAASAGVPSAAPSAAPAPSAPKAHP